MKKEWNGNSKSAHYSLAINKKDSTEKREPDDFYATDPEALNKLIIGSSNFLSNLFDYMRKHDLCILEPACGNGNLAECLKQHGYKVIASDLKDRGYGLTGIDFLKHGNKDRKLWCFIITNPPYSLATEFIEHALEIMHEGGGCIVL